MRDVPSYLAGYERRMAQGDFLHLGTHPPGLILFHRACINLCTAIPALRDLLLRTAAGIVSRCDGRDRTDRIAHGPRQSRRPIGRRSGWRL